MPSYLDPKNDLVFKRIFGEHPTLLISFLNALLPLGDDRYIVTLEYLPSELVPDIFDGRNSIVDVRCRDNHDRQFIVEMQNYWNGAFLKRLLYNSTKAYVRQLEASQDFSLLQPVYGLGLLNDVRTPFDNTTDFFHHYIIVNKEAPSDVIKDIEFFLVELPRFKPETWAHRKLAVLWLRFLSEVRHGEQDIDAEFLANPEISQAVELCKRAAFTEAELDVYDKVWLDAITHRSALKISEAEGEKRGEERGEKRGEERGEQRGKHEKALEISRKLRQKKTPISEIAELTGLAIADIEQL